MIVKKLSPLDQMLTILLFCLSFLSIEPYIIWGNFEILKIITMLYIVLTIVYNRLVYNKITILSIIILIYFVFVRVSKFSNFYSDTAIAILLIPFVSNEKQIIFSKIFNWTVTLFAVLYCFGIPIFIITKFIDLPSVLIKGRNLIMIEEFHNYLFLVSPIKSIDIFPRFNSVFDEPGVVGTISSILLCGFRYRFKNWKSIIILIGGILSFSLFFYISSIILMILFNYKKLKYFIASLLVIILLLKMYENNEIVSKLIFDRLTISEDKTILGMNRTTDIWDYEYANFLKKGNFVFGESNFDAARFPYVAHYSIFIYQFGILGAFFVLLFYYIYLRRFNQNIDSLIVIICLIMAFYQRPWPFSYYYLILSIAVISNLNINKKIYE